MSGDCRTHAPLECPGPRSQISPQAPLGRVSDYPTQYQPGLLFPIARAEARATLGLASNQATGPDASPPRSGLPFSGVDLWNAYELSWLGPSGKPEARAAQFRVPCESPAIIESKSLKLYLNSLNQHRFDSPATARATIETDLSQAAGAPVQVRLFTLPELGALGFPVQSDSSGRQDGTNRAGETTLRSLDDLNPNISDYTRNPDLLRFANGAGGDATTAAVYTDLFKSNCPVTGQPDWASVFIKYAGPAIDETGLLAYLISYRNEQDFHEHCVEQIFVDVNERCRPEKLTVYACFLRRGGIDINPFRSNFEAAPEFLRSERQ